MVTLIIEHLREIILYIELFLIILNIITPQMSFLNCDANEINRIATKLLHYLFYTK